MRIAVKGYLPLFKLRICSVIAFSAVAGLFSASGRVSATAAISLALVTLMSSAGASAFNHYFDVDIDALMQRTKGRPMPSGTVGGHGKVLLAAALLFSASILLSSRLLNYMVGVHLFLGGFTYAVVYTVWLKRRTWLNIVVGGLAGSFAVLAGGASAVPGLCLKPVLLALIMFFWTPSHFWSFAIVHREEYQRAGVPMLPAVAGDIRASRYILVNTVLLVVSSALPALSGTFGIVYTLAAAGLGAFFIMRNIELVRNPSKEVAWKNFKASMVYLGGLLAAVIIDASINI